MCSSQSITSESRGEGELEENEKSKGAFIFMPGGGGAYEGHIGLKARVEFAFQLFDGRKTRRQTVGYDFKAFLSGTSLPIKGEKNPDILLPAVPRLIYA